MSFLPCHQAVKLIFKYNVDNILFICTDNVKMKQTDETCYTRVPV